MGRRQTVLFGLVAALFLSVITVCLLDGHEFSLSASSEVIHDVGVFGEEELHGVDSVDSEKQAKSVKAKSEDSAIVAILKAPDVVPQPQKRFFRNETLNEILERRRNLLRLQFEHLNKLSKVANKVGMKLVAVSSAGLTAEERRHVRLVLGASVVESDPGFEMRTVVALRGRFSKVTFLRTGYLPGEYLFKENSCIALGKYGFEDETTGEDAKGDNSSENASTRRGLLPFSLETQQIDIDQLKRAKRDILSWKDERLRFVSALVIKADTPVSPLTWSTGDLTEKFGASDENQCIGGISLGFELPSIPSCVVESVDEASLSNIMGISALKGLYPLPLNFPLKSFDREDFAKGLLDDLAIMEKTEIENCLDEINVRNMFQLGNSVIFKDLRDKKMKLKDERFKNYYVVMKALPFNERVNRTMHAWAFSLERDLGVPFLVTKLANSNLTEFIEEAKRPRGSFDFLFINATSMVLETLPKEAVEGAVRACENPFNNQMLCKNPDGKGLIFNPKFRNVANLGWLWTILSTLVTLRELLEIKPELEYVWFFEADVQYSGRLSDLLLRTGDDDSDILAISWENAHKVRPESIRDIEKKRYNSQNVMWWGLLAAWQSERTKFGHLHASSIRLSRRFIHWCLEAAFIPLDWSIDETFFWDVCTRNPECKYTPLQFYGLGLRLNIYYVKDRQEYYNRLQSDNGAFSNELWHAIKKETVDPLEKWLFIQDVNR